ncbi:MAG: UDP-N-acetylmuramoyl-L-alanyl-D-glutamate--2,6-diaminopimelate ligase [Candidatus Paceibacterota bacterium]
MKSIIKQLKKVWWGIKSLGAMHYYGNPSKKLKVVGVTGTNGKTTTATLLYKIATALGYKAGLISTVENIIVTEVRPATHTTPDSITLTKLFKDMLDAGCEYVFMEVSSHALDQNRVRGVHFVGGIFTNLTHDHLDYHKNFENYFGAKKKFFKMLPPRAFALTNVDNEYGVKMLSGIEANKFSYGFDNEAHFKGEVSKIDFSGLELKFNDISIHSKILGKFNAYNLLAVWSACSLLGFDMQKVNKILENIEPPKGRFQHFMSPTGVLVVVDYAHSPDALEKILAAVQEIKTENGKLISVFGCGGDRDPMKRPIMGKIGARLSDIAIFTADNPRSEDPDKIISEMLPQLHSEELKRVLTIVDRRKAIKKSITLAKKGDIILCAGKGHEDYQIIKDIKSHFDDMEEFKKLYARL